MADIREILKALSPEDSALYTQHRVEMRRSFITAHNSVLGVVRWDNGDDMFLDYIDITLATLFHRGGRLNTTKTVVATEDLEIIEKQIDQRMTKTNSQKTLDDIHAKQLAQESANTGNGNSNGKVDAWPVK